MGKYVLKRSGSQFHFTLKGGNGETILTSERYVSKQGALEGIQSAKESSSIAARYEKKDASNGQPMFNLRSSNGEVIGTSETYSSSAARDGGIMAVMANGPTSPTIDET